MQNMTKGMGYDAVALLSGGLDSILAVKVVEEQGVRVKCLHFTSPFFGKPKRLAHWRSIYGLDIDAVDVGDEFVSMMARGPVYGFGRFLNPCVDCKILMATRAKGLLEVYGARFIISGEVLGQRPMSQRRDTLNIISRDAVVRDILVRPLCALRLEPTVAERTGLVDRERLLGISGRGRKEQLALAQRFDLKEVPTPAGGCMLAEQESARRYWPVLRHAQSPRAVDFDLANTGRQFWAGAYWLVIGRNRADNERLAELLRPEDTLFKVQGFPGPLCLGRTVSGTPWPADAIVDAAAFVASFSPKAMATETAVRVIASCQGEAQPLLVRPSRATALGWAEPAWTGREGDPED